MSVDSVIVLNDFCSVQGGASKVALDEAVALSGRGLNVTFIGAVGPVDERLEHSGVHVICLDQPELATKGRAPGAAMRALWNQRALRTMRQTLSRLDSRRSIVHLHGYTKALTTTPMLAARRSGFSTICTLHDFFAACPNGAFYDYRRERPCELHGLSPACVLRDCDKRRAAHKAYRVMRGASQRYLARFPSTVRDYITLSRRSAALLAPYLPADTILYPLDNIIEAQPGPPTDAAANRTIVSIGRLDTEKGVVLAARAAQSCNWPITFVGDGPLRPAVEALGARVTGWISPAQVRSELHHARCLLFPSLWYETYGLVVDEAAACGVPAIVSDISAAAERIEHDVTGWLCPTGSLDGLIAALSVIRDDPVVRAAGHVAYERFWNAPPDANRHTGALLSIYAAVLARGVPG